MHIKTEPKFTLVSFDDERHLVASLDGRNLFENIKIERLSEIHFCVYDSNAEIVGQVSKNFQANCRDMWSHDLLPNHNATFLFETAHDALVDAVIRLWKG